MYSLALIIFVVSEKKAFEHFPIGSNVNLCIAVAKITVLRSAVYLLRISDYCRPGTVPHLNIIVII
jgi:hypothetical protein